MFSQSYMKEIAPAKGKKTSLGTQHAKKKLRCFSTGVKHRAE